MAGTFFGIGAQKAGTSWLYQLLSLNPGCKPLPVKEMHFFDRKYAATPPSNEQILRDVRRLVESTAKLADRFDKGLSTTKTQMYQDGFLAKQRIGMNVEQIVRLAERLSVIDTDSYVRYIEDWRARWPDKVIGEITPAYSTLPSQGFAELTSLYQDARYIFIMRDPVSRMWSHLRFANKNQSGMGDLNERVAASLQQDSYTVRSDYARTVREMDALVPQDRIHYVFFEEMVSPDTAVREVSRIEDFLSLSHLGEEAIQELVNQPANVAPKAVMTEESSALLVDALRPQYEFVAERFGRLPTAWHRLR
jgi:hypothetical protein